MGYGVEDLEKQRDRRFRRLPRIRVHSERTALQFVDDVGFCLVFTNRTQQLPCLWVAVCGRRDPVFPEHSHHDPELMLTWNLKDLLPAKRRVYYGKLILGKPSMVSLAHFPDFYALHGPAHDEQYLYDYEDGLLSRAAKQIMDALVERKLYITMIEARYEPAFTYVWDLLEAWLPTPVARGREIPRHEAVYRLTRQYLSVVYYASLTQIERVVGVPRAELEEAATRLQDEGVAEVGARIHGLAGTWMVWRQTVIDPSLMH
jgi:hypothetical protein